MTIPPPLFSVRKKEVIPMVDPIHLSRIFGPFLVILGVWTLFSQENVRKVSEAMRKSLPFSYLAGLINLLIGLVVMNAHPSWKWNFMILLSLMGWIFFIRGLLILFFPSLTVSLAKVQERGYILFGLISFLWGIALCYMAFFTV
ncbi:MAG: hypothetical protein HYZ47_00585 [Simkania negevensis]|nr:hypothetical protein [Simkania negevensis]